MILFVRDKLARYCYSMVVTVNPYIPYSVCEDENRKKSNSEVEDL
jgi:hypothetical protein